MLFGWILGEESMTTHKRQAEACRLCVVALLMNLLRACTTLKLKTGKHGISLVFIFYASLLRASIGMRWGVRDGMFSSAANAANAHGV